MLATMQTTSAFDNLIARIQAFLNDDTQPGFGTLTTSEDMAEVEVTFKPNPGESFRAFADRVFTYADGAPIEWHIQSRQVPLARVRRKLS
jgi:hypothetical protein